VWENRGMNFLDSLILGGVEGVTEFLPISSTGHLILVSDLLGLPDTDFLKSFQIAIQLGAILSVVFLYWRLIFTKFEVVKRVLAAFLPTAVIGLAFYSLVKKYLLGSEMVVLAALFLGGVLMIIFEKFYKEKEDSLRQAPAFVGTMAGRQNFAHRQTQGSTVEIKNLSYKKAIWIGLFQSLAIVPGVSRAAATIIGGLVLGMRRKTIVEFSFLLAIPTMAAATGLDLLKNFGSIQPDEFGFLGVGFVMAFITAILSIKFLLRFIETHDFTAFGVYRMLVAVAFLLWVV